MGRRIRKSRIEKVYKENSKVLEKMDKQRSSYYNFFTKQKYGEVENYDICLDSGYLGIEKCVDIIYDIYRKK